MLLRVSANTCRVPSPITPISAGAAAGATAAAGARALLDVGSALRGRSINHLQPMHEAARVIDGGIDFALQIARSVRQLIR